MKRQREIEALIIVWMVNDHFLESMVLRELCTYMACNAFKAEARANGKASK